MSRHGGGARLCMPIFAYVDMTTDHPLGWAGHGPPQKPSNYDGTCNVSASTLTLHPTEAILQALDHPGLFQEAAPPPTSLLPARVAKRASFGAEDGSPKIYLRAMTYAQPQVCMCMYMRGGMRIGPLALFSHVCAFFVYAYATKAHLFYSFVLYNFSCYVFACVCTCIFDRDHVIIYMRVYLNFDCTLVWNQKTCQYTCQHVTGQAVGLACT